MTDNPVPPRIPPRRPPAFPVPPAIAPKQPVPPAAAFTQASAVTTVQIVDTGETVSARGSGEYRIRRYLMTVLLVAGGLWFAYDGWKGWPAENAKIEDLNHRLDEATKAGNTELMDSINADPLTHKTPHSPLDLRWQKILAFSLPIGGILFLVWTLRNSRGEYRLEAGRLSIPGHPPVSIAEITEIDRSKWDRKGIAYLHYKTSSGAAGTIRLDDFVYQQEPTDEIFKRIEAFVAQLA